jgi:hypothetical protein
VGRKSRLYRSELNVSRILFNSSKGNKAEDASFSDIENQICHLKTFSNLSHRRYAKMLYKKIKKQLLITHSNDKKSVLNKLAYIIELKISTTL